MQPEMSPADTQLSTAEGSLFRHNDHNRSGRGPGRRALLPENKHARLLLRLLYTALALLGLTRLGSLAYFLTAVVPLGLTLVSYYKTIINGEPLMLTDFSLAGNIANVAGFAMDRITISPATGALAVRTLSR